MILNYYALTIAILSNCFPETAFKKLQSAEPNKTRPVILPEDIYLMHKYKSKGLSYTQIGRIYGVSKETICGQMRRKKVPYHANISKYKGYYP
jgi:hypothetical protein